MRTDKRYKLWRLGTAFLMTALLVMGQAASAGQRSKKDKEKDKGKDKDADISQMGAQCSPGTGEAVAPEAAASTPTSTPIDEVIRQFAQHESDFKLARDNYTYSQNVLVEDVAPNPGEYRLESDIVFTPEGKRYQKDTYAPVPTLHDFTLSPQDYKDLENIQPFVLTTEDLPKYDIQYAGTEKLDELNTYKFCVGPKRIEKNERYFQGTIWVDSHDLAVVKTDGKAVPDIVKGDNQNLFPRFVTYRENIEANFWFPTYTHADDVLHFRQGDVRMRMTVRYKNYKRFGSTIELGKSKEIPATPSNPQQPEPDGNK
jgi:hypothetical protein